jgi:ribosomal protein L11 methyltransferase
VSADPAVRVSVPAAWTEVVGATLMDLLGPFQQVDEAEEGHLVFYPYRHGAGYVSDEAILEALPCGLIHDSAVTIERLLVPPGWEEGWKDHFHPLTLGRLYIRAPWEPRPTDIDLLDVVLTPGLAFGTGLHATTRAVLLLMQRGETAGPVVDAGTGSGILSIAAARLGYRPVRAFDNDPLAVEAARANAVDNGVEVEVALHDVLGAPATWFAGATVFANITANPVITLLTRLGGLEAPVARVLASGILAGEQEALVTAAAERAAFRVFSRRQDGEWVGLEFSP